MMSGSELYMSSQYGNSASLAIEVAASPLIPEHVWVDFKVGRRREREIFVMICTERSRLQLEELQGQGGPASASEATLGQGVPSGGRRSGYL